MSKSGRRNDVRIGADAMQRKNFPAELSHADCVLARNPAGGCPNTLKCRNAFGSPEHQSNAIFDLRAKLFQPGKTRSSLLKGELISMMHSGTCHFVMSGVLVCKSYYRLSTGFRRQLFDECINKILVPSSDELKSPASSASLTPFLTKKKKKPAAEDETLAALDLIFSDKTIKEDPTKNMTKVHVRTRWQTVYDTDYKRIVPRHKRVDYNKFVSIRKQHRPLYMKSPRMRKGGWDHMVCGECQRLEDEMYRVGPYHEMRPILEKELIDHDNLSTSLIQLSHRKVQKCTGKLFDRPDREVMDTVISTDAAGSSGFTRLPHKPFYSAEERPMREYLLRVHTEFTMVHGHASFASVSLKDLETGGPNMVFDSLCRALFLTLERNPHVKQFGTVYVCMDNTCSSNKNWTLFQGLACLVVLGIARKVKIIFRLVGHTKNEVDQLAGIISNQITPNMYLTPEEWLRGLEDAVQTGDPSYQVAKASFNTLAPDYDAAFKDAFGVRNATGISRIQVVRFAAHETEETATMYYKADPRSGWMPKWGMPGLPEFTCSHWKTVFPHEDKSQGHPTSVDAASLHKVKGRGKRQAWNFRVKYAMGDTKDIIKQSDGIPLGVSRAAALRLIESGFKVQTVTEASIAELRIVRSTISQLLETYGSESDHDAWDQFFDQRIPTSIDDPMLSVSRRDTWLHQLYSKCGGEIRRKEYVDIDDKIPLSHFADSLVFPQGVLTKKSRDQVITYCKERVENVRILKGEQSRKNKKRRPAIEATSSRPAVESSPTTGKKRGRPRTKRTSIKSLSPSEGVSSGGDSRKPKEGGLKRTKAAKRSVRFDIDDESAASVSSANSSAESDTNSSVNSEIYSDFNSDTDVNDDMSECASEASDASYKSVDEPPMTIPKRLRELYWSKVGALCWVRLPKKDWENDDDDDDTEEEKLCKIIGVSEYEAPDIRFQDRLVFKFAPQNIKNVTSDDIQHAGCSEMIDCDWAKWVAVADKSIATVEEEVEEEY